MSHSQSRHHGRAVVRPVVGLTVALLAAGAFAAPAVAAAPRPAHIAHKPAVPAASGQMPARWARVYAAQNRLDAAAARIQAADPGNPSIMVDPQHPRVVVYWYGRVPASVRALAGRLGVRVVFRPARYTVRTLVAAAKRLLADPRVNLVAPEPDGSGLAVTITTRHLAPGQPDLLAAGPISLKITVGPPPQSLAGRTPGRPVTGQTRSRPAISQPAYSRQNDIPPYWGGALYTTADGGGCSLGFSLNVPGQPAEFELSAGHCGANGDNVTIPGQPNPTGTIENLSACEDVLQVNLTPGGVVGGYIYTGNASSSTAARIVGAGGNVAGDLVDTGGAESGEHDGLTVTNVNAYTTNHGTTPCPAHGSFASAWGPFIIATLAGGCAAAAGDSGGPVYTYPSPPSTTTARGRGTISIGRNLVTGGCTNAAGHAIDGYSTVLYAPLEHGGNSGSLQHYGDTLLTR